MSTIWSGTKGKINHGPRQQVLARRRLGNKTVEVLGLLGKGSFAGVFSCRAIGSQEAMAVKLEREVRAGSLNTSLNANNSMCLVQGKKLLLTW